MSESVISTQGLTRCFDRVTALNAVDLNVESGNILALLGPNGAGKTTFLRLLMGLLEPSEGHGSIFGEDTRAMSHETASRVGYMADTAEPPKWLTVEQLIDLKACVAPRFDHERMRDWLKVTQDSRYGTLSKGQKKWVRAGVTLAAGPDLVLMDEPAEGLDPSARRALYDHLRDYVNEYEATVVVTTHVISDIERVADDVAILRQGRLVLHGLLEDLREEVHEVQLPQDDASVVWPESVEILGRQTGSHEQIHWVRCEPGMLETVPLDRADIKPVSLERLYFLMTETNT
ncbi:MAG: ABC transporter ATP-binding protein [Phycisphaerae bacterium]|nr:ABC transporter ATP-binding protein [Phycisphaerae bacterium]